MSKTNKFFKEVFSPEEDYIRNTMLVTQPTATTEHVNAMIEAIAMVAKSLITEKGADGGDADVAMQMAFDKLTHLHLKLAPEQDFGEFMDSVDSLMEAVISRFNDTIRAKYAEFVIAVSKDNSFLASATIH